MRSRNGAGDENPYLDCWDPEDDDDADPPSERLGPWSPEPPHGSITAHGKSSLNERTSMHWPGNQRTEFRLTDRRMGEADQ